MMNDEAPVVVPMRRETEQSRREMFHASVRYAVLGGLAVLSARLLDIRHSASGIRDSSFNKCPESAPCRRCALLSNCALPRASAAKKASKRYLLDGRCR